MSDDKNYLIEYFEYKFYDIYFFFSDLKFYYNSSDDKVKMMIKTILTLIISGFVFLLMYYIISKYWDWFYFFEVVEIKLNYNVDDENIFLKLIKLNSKILLNQFLKISINLNFWKY